MSNFLEQLQTRHADAQKRLAAVQQEMQVMQARYQAVVQEFNSLGLLLKVESAKQQSAGAPTSAAPTTTATKSFKADAVLVSRTEQPTASSSFETNKTEAIRALIRQYPNGIAPTEIWKQVKTHMKHRPYLYSILKRLKDRDEVIERRGKYIATPKSEEGKMSEMTLET